MEENRIKIWIHKIKDTAVVLLHFLAVCSPLSLVCVITPELLAGETIGQWVWFGKAVLFSAGCIVAACLLQFSMVLLGRRCYPFRVFPLVYHGV